MRTGISITVGSLDCVRLEGVVRERSHMLPEAMNQLVSLFKATTLVSRSHEIMRRTGKSKTCVWRWQERDADGPARRDGY